MLVDLLLPGITRLRTGGAVSLWPSHLDDYSFSCTSCIALPRLLILCRMSEATSSNYAVMAVASVASRRSDSSSFVSTPPAPAAGGDESHDTVLLIRTGRRPT